MAPEISRQRPRKGKTQPEKKPEAASESDSDDSQSNDEAQEQSEDSEEIEELQDEESEVDKDDMELELEKLVFGDSAGFREGLRSFDVDKKGSGLDVDMSAATEDDGDDTAELGGLADGDLFFVDSGPATQAVIPSAQADLGAADQDIKESAAWEDSDDDRIMVSIASVPRLRKLRITEAEDVISGKEYSRRLRMQFERLNPPPDWAHPPKQSKRRRKSQTGGSETDSSDDEMDVDEELSAQPLAKLLQDSDALTKGPNGRNTKKRKLAAEKINISRLKDVPGEQPSSISSLSFHPTYPLLLSSGIAKTAWLHHILPYPPLPNPLVTSLHIPGQPLDTVSFHPSPTDTRVFLSSRRRHFHIWDLPSGNITKANHALSTDREQQTMDRFKISPCGKYIAFAGPITKSSGAVTIVSAITSQLVTHARIESSLADFAWWADGSGLSIVGTGGEVSEYSLLDRRFTAVWQDEGALHITTIALGGRSGHDDFFGGDRWIAIGSRSGIVNIYDRTAWLPGKQQKQQQKQKQQQQQHRPAPSKPTDSHPTTLIPRRPTPKKSLDNLVTTITCLAFAPDGQVLAMASRGKKDALRLVHLPSCSVFQNWPTQNTPLGRVTALAWTHGSVLAEGEGAGEGRGTGLYVMAVGNERGQIKLWEVGL
ncbi:WD40 repeat-like protein [Pseudovirgaria hyperparasitica]|uniref:WD40 repeat-like protein n=1 Tax=Pseudovirgaria hyperparasitica TaxID=470096 RepID=A0A6A6WDB9_9PEZI|nr:WD40 repeat-like protein [Pseudovirgaria hyperparasitica]KAF2759960.1 WD40 repeat-like protein [Pseudovirgaria hyperparasitica]